MNSFLKRSKYFFGLGIAFSISLTGLLGLVTIAPSSVVPQQKVEAAALPYPGNWLDNSHITFDGEIYTGPILNNGKYVYSDPGPHKYGTTCLSGQTGSGGNGGVVYRLSFSQDPTKVGNDPSTATFEGNYIPDLAALQKDPTAPDGCTPEANATVNMTNLNAALLPQAYASCANVAGRNMDACVTQAIDKSCQGSANNPVQYQQCISTKTSSYQQGRTIGLAGGQTDQHVGCDQNDGLCQSVAADAANPTQDDPTGCNLDGDPLTWIICPVIKLLEDGIQLIDNFITSALTFDTATAFDTSNGYYAAFNSFRVLAYGILGIAALVMVSSQAFGFEFLDAYTMKKTLPRLVIAIIALTIAWPLMKFAIDFFNTFGLDVRGIIYSPFKSLQGSLSGSTLFIFGAGFVALFLALKGTIVTFLLTGLLAVLVGFLIIMVRYMAILVLIVFAPVAIVCYVLPNTQKVWNLWRENFVGMLLVFPIISAFIAVGHVFSAVALTQPDKAGPILSNTAMQAIGFIMYFLPYFLLPIAFRMATGVIGSISGFVNDRHKGAFDRLKKARGTAAATNWQKAKAGEYSNNAAVNAFTMRATTSRFGMGRRGRQAMQQKRAIQQAQFAKSDAGQALQHNDNVLRALTYDSAAAAEDSKTGLAARFNMSQEEVRNAIAGAKASGGFGKNRQVYAAQQLAMTGTGYKNLDQVAATIAQVADGNEAEIDAISGNINSTTKSAGRHDLAPGAGNLASLAKGAHNAANPLSSKKFTPKPLPAPAAELAWDSGSLYQHANDKTQNIDNAIAHYSTLLGASSSLEQREKAAVFFNEIKSMRPNASGGVKESINKALDTHRDSIAALTTEGSSTFIGHSPPHVSDRGAPGAKLFVPDGGGWRETRAPSGPATPETAASRVERKSRTYERPDPANLS